MVALSTVIFAPMAQLGCFSASCMRVRVRVKVGVVVRVGVRG